MMLVRADASFSIGTGHVLRTLALAQLWIEQGGQVALAAVELPDFLEERVIAEGVTVKRLTVPAGHEEDARNTVALARACNADWIVLDGYHFNIEFQMAIKHAGLRLLIIDDFAHLPFYFGDIIVNPNMYISTPRYSVERTTRVLVGPDYVLLRKEFWSWRNWRREIPEVAQRLLITMGGSDPDNATARALEALRIITLPLSVDVVVGGANPYLQDQMTGSRHRISLRYGVTDMPQQWAKADIAIIGAGNSLWEALYMGVPTLSIARNEFQHALIRSLDDDNIAWYAALDSHPIEHGLRPINSRRLNNLLLSRDKRHLLSTNARQTIDGQGVFRVLAEMRV